MTSKSQQPQTTEEQTSLTVLTPRQQQLLAIEQSLAKQYSGIFTKRELLVDRGIPFKAIANTKSQRTGLWLSEAIPDDEDNTRANLVGRVIDRLAHQLTCEVGF